MNMRDAFPSKFLAARDLDGEDKTLKIKDVVQEEMGSFGTKWVVYFYGCKKGMVLNKMQSIVIIDELGTEDSESWPGEYITLFPDRILIAGAMKDVIGVRAGAEAKKARKIAEEAEAAKKSTKTKAAAATGEADDDVPF